MSVLMCIIHFTYICVLQIIMACSRDLRLIMIGKTGTGKSTTANNIMRKKLFQAAAGGSSVTKKCQLRDDETFGRSVSIVDTPGLYDANMKEVESFTEIVRSVAMVAPGPHAILFILQVGRCTNEDLKTMAKFSDHFGQHLQKYIIPVFTRYDDWKRDTDNSFENYIDTLPTNAKTFIQETCNGRYIPFDNTLTGDSSEQQVRALIQSVDEIVLRNGGECYSDENIREAQRIINENKEKFLQHQREKEEELEQKWKREIETFLKEWKDDSDARDGDDKTETNKLLEMQREIFKQEIQREISLKESGGWMNTMFDGLKNVAEVTNNIRYGIDFMKGVKLPFPSLQAEQVRLPLLCSQLQKSSDYLYCGQYRFPNYGNVLQNTPF